MRPRDRRGVAYASTGWLVVTARSAPQPRHVRIAIDTSTASGPTMNHVAARHERVHASRSGCRLKRGRRARCVSVRARAGLVMATVPARRPPRRRWPGHQGPPLLCAKGLYAINGSTMERWSHHPSKTFRSGVPAAPRCRAGGLIAELAGREGLPPSSITSRCSSVCGSRGGGARGHRLRRGLRALRISFAAGLHDDYYRCLFAEVGARLSAGGAGGG